LKIIRTLKSSFAKYPQPCFVHQCNPTSIWEPPGILLGTTWVKPGRMSGGSQGEPEGGQREK